MGTSRSIGDFARKLERAARVVDTAGATGVTRAATVVTNSVRAELRAAAPSGRLRGVGRKGAPVSVGFDVKGFGGNAAALVKARGPWPLIESDTKPHEIKPRAKRAAGGPAALALVGGQFRARVARHPGTHGKHPWEHGVAAGAPLAARAFSAGVQADLRKAFS